MSEDVAEGDEGNKAKRVEKALVFEVRLNAALDGFEVGEKISMSEDDAARLGSSAGGEENLGDVLAGERFGGDGFEEWLGCFTRNSLACARRNGRE